MSEEKYINVQARLVPRKDGGARITIFRGFKDDSHAVSFVFCRKEAERLLRRDLSQGSVRLRLRLRDVHLSARLRKNERGLLVKRWDGDADNGVAVGIRKLRGDFDCRSSLTLDYHLFQWATTLDLVKGETRKIAVRVHRVLAR